MNLQGLDYYALKKYNFQIKKINSHFSITTIIATLIIIAISFFISYSYVEHLWLPTQQLPTTESVTLSYSKYPLTQTKICIRHQKPAQLMAAVQLKNLPLSKLQLSSLSQKFKALAVWPYQLSCYSIAGLLFKKNSQYFYFQIISNETQAYKIYLSTTNIDQVSTRQQSIVQLVYFSSVISRHEITLIEYTLKDKLWMNYEPQIRVMVEKLRFNTAQYDYSLYPPARLTFALKLHQPAIVGVNKLSSNNIRRILVQRYDIATIIGAFLSWLSVLLLIFGLMIVPIMEMKLNLIQAEILFHVKLDYQKPSLFKFYIAHIKSGIFEKEDKYIELCSQLQKLKDVGFILKIQHMAKRITPLSQNQRNIEVIASQHNFDQPQNEDFGIQYYKQEIKHNDNQFQGSSQEQKQHFLIRFRKSFLKFLDPGSQDISINYNKQGYGSLQSLFLTVIFLLGFIIFISLSGVFHLKSEEIQKGIIKDKHSYTLNKNQILLVSDANFSFTITVVDGNYNAISSTFLNGSNPSCYNRVPQSYRSDVNIKGSYYNCLDENIQMVYSTNLEQCRMIVINDKNDPSLTNIHQTAIFHFQDDDQEDIIQNPTSYTFWPEQMGVYQLINARVFQNSDGSKKLQFAPKTLTRSYTPPYQKLVYGQMIALQNFIVQKLDEQGQIFDIVQNFWSFTVICFTVILAKITKHINLRRKQKIIGPETSQFRDSLQILMSRINGIINGKNAKEISKTKFYFKQKLHTL